MYHRFNETKYPSTNIQLTVFKEQLKIIEDGRLRYINNDMRILSQYAGMIHLKKMNKQNTYIGIEEVILADEYLINYNKFIVSLIINSLNLKSIENTVDFGSGIGTLAKIFYEKFN